MVVLFVYVIGVAIALAVMRDPWRERLAPAVLWPLGPVAFAIVVTVLLTAAAILWPLPVVGAAAALAATAWLLLT